MAFDWFIRMRGACHKYIVEHELKEIEDLARCVHMLRIECTVLPIERFNNFNNKNFDEWNEWLTDCKEGVWENDFI